MIVIGTNDIGIESKCMFFRNKSVQYIIECINQNLRRNVPKAVTL